MELTIMKTTIQAVLDMAFALPLSEQAQIVRRVQDNIFLKIGEQEEPTSEQLKQRLSRSYAQAMSGETTQPEQAHLIMDNFVNKRVV